MFNKTLRRAALEGDIQTLLEEIRKKEPYNGEATINLEMAAKEGHLECVKALIPLSDPKHSYSYALRVAAMNGHAECVRELIPVSNPKDEESLALQWATECFHPECVELLIPVSNPKANDSYIIRKAITGAIAIEDTRCIELLAPHSDLNAEYGYVLRTAVEFGMNDLAKKLIPMCDCDKAISYMKEQGLKDSVLRLESFVAEHRLKEKHSIPRSQTKSAKGL